MSHLNPDDAILRALARLLAEPSSAPDIPPDQWPALVRLAVRSRLGPVLLWTLKQHATPPCPPPEMARLVTATRQAALRWMVLSRTARQLNRVWAEAGIPAIWLKGIALALTVYPQPALRPMNDLDVLVPYEQRQAALALARSAGFDECAPGDLLFDPRSRAYERVSHHYILTSQTDNPVIVELHYRLLRPRMLLSREQAAWFWTQTRPAPGDEPALTVFQAEARLLYLAAHAMLHHGEEAIGLNSLFDLHQLITGGALDWDTVIERAVAFRWTYGVEQALQRIVAFFGTPVPGAVLDQLQARRPVDENVLHAILLQGEGARWERMSRAMEGLSPWEKLGVVFNMVFPARGFLRARYGVPPERGVRRYYLRWWREQAQHAWGWWRTRHWRAAEEGQAGGTPGPAPCGDGPSS